MLNGRWQSKPPPGTPIDPYGPFASGLIAAWTINEGTGPALYNAVNPNLYQGVFQSGAAAPTWRGGPNGAGITTVSASLQYVDHGTIGPLAGALKATIFAVGNRASAKIWTVGTSSHNGQRFGIQVFSDNFIYYLSECAGSTGGFSRSLVGLVNGDFTIANAFDGTQSSAANGMLCYLNGVAQSIAPSAVWTPPNALATGTDPWRTGLDMANARYSDARYDLTLLWVGRTLSALEIASLHANAWQVFLPPSPYLLYYSPVSAPRFRRTLYNRAGSRGVYA